MMLLVLSLLAVGPGDAPGLLRSAAESVRAGDLEAAYGFVEQALAADPEDAQALLAQARLLRRLDRAAEATVVLDKLLRLDAHADEARYELALAQWQAGDVANAAVTTGALLERHPQHAEALKLRQELALGRTYGTVGGGASALAPVLRLGVSAIYDSNLPAVDVEGPTDKAAGLLDVDLVAGVAWAKPGRPLMLLARLTAQNPLQDRESFGGLTPSTLGLAAIGRRPLGPLLGVLDLRYSEVFVDNFASHRLRLFGPSAHASLRLGSQTVRLLVGADLRTPDAAAVASSATLRAGVRDTIRRGALEVAVDATYRHDAKTGDADEALPGPGTSASLPAGSLVGFDEVAGVGFATYALAERASVEALLEVARRTYAQSAWVSGAVLATRAQLGGRYELDDDVELHAEYRFEHSGGVEALSFQRHQVSAGVRFWYE